MKKFIIPFVIIAFGVGFLLASMNVIDVNKMIWTVSLLCAGITLLVYFGVNKTTFTVGSLLIIGSGMSLLRYQGYVTIEKELPILIIIFGVLMGISRTNLVPKDHDGE